MTAAVLSFPPPVDSHEALLTLATELHALIALDAGGGSSPARIYFVMSRAGKREVSAHLAPAGASPTTEFYALIAYDFPFALFQFQLSGARISPERAEELIICSARLRENSLARAAAAMGMRAAPVSSFDADALKEVFFPNTQETVIQVMRLSRAGA